MNGQPKSQVTDQPLRLRESVRITHPPRTQSLPATAGAERGALHWQPPPPPEVVSSDFHFTTEPLITGWNRALERPVAVEVATVPLACRRTAGDPDSHSPGVDSRAEFRIPRAQRSRLYSARREASRSAERDAGRRRRRRAEAQRHADSPAGGRDQAGRSPELSPATAAGGPAGRSRVGDAAGSRFPFSSKAWRSSIRGMRRSWPTRWGWERRMQAITAIRLLLRRGEIRSVLMVCPKPLVTNWQREFQLWAPEVPALAIEGDQARRAWQWRLPDVPLRIANYEVVIRDREILEGGEDGRPIRLRPGRARRIAADQEPRQHHQRGRPRPVAAAELGPDRHARGKQRRRPGRHLRVPRAGLPFAGDEAAEDGPHRERLRPAADEGASAHRVAAQDVPRRRAGTRRPSSARPIAWPKKKALSASPRWARGRPSSTSSSSCCG